MIKEKRSVFLFMDKRILEQLENVPSNVEDAFKDLTELCDSFIKLNGISEEERKRLNYELELIKKWGIAKVILFGFHLILNEGFGATYGVEGNSFVNYLLGISTVNPVKYNLPFERFYNENRNYLPIYNIIVEKGKKGFLLKSLYEKFGKNKIIKSKEDNDNYFVSNKPINPEFISETRIVAKENEEAYVENISFLSYSELTKLGYYNFSINEVEEIKYSGEERFSEEEIYEKAKKDFSYSVNVATPFTDIEEVKEVLVNTDYKLIYQEQLMEILRKLCGFDMAKADHYRREIAKAKKDNLEEIKKIMFEKFGENGQKLFDYLYKTGRYAVSKACVIASLCVVVEY